MQTAGHIAEIASTEVHAIHVWHSSRRGRWYVECVNESGDRLGPAYACASEEEARDCLEDWLRGNPSTCFTHEGGQDERRTSDAKARGARRTRHAA